MTDFLKSEPRGDRVGPYENNINPEIFTRIQEYQPEYILFPNLRYFLLPKLWENSIPIAPLLSPQLRIVEIQQMRRNRNSEILSSVLKHSPRVTHLILIGMISPALLSPLHLFRSLESLSIFFNENNNSERESPLERQAFEIMLDGLRHLSCVSFLSLNFPDRGYRPPRTSVLYPGIRKLELCGQSAAIARQLTMFSQLEEVSLNFTDAHDDMNDIHRCCEYLARNSGDSLRALVLNSEDFIPMSAYMPLLFSIHNIGYFASNEFWPRISSDNSHIDDMNPIAEMVEAWPLLEQLIIPGVERSLPTFTKLLPLARLSCLRNLSLPAGVKIPMDPFEELSDLDKPTTNEIIQAIFGKRWV